MNTAASSIQKHKSTHVFLLDDGELARGGGRWRPVQRAHRSSVVDVGSRYLSKDRGFGACLPACSDLRQTREAWRRSSMLTARGPGNYGTGGVSDVRSLAGRVRVAAVHLGRFRMDATRCTCSRSAVCFGSVRMNLCSRIAASVRRY